MVVYYMLDPNSGPVDARSTLSSDHKLNGRMVQQMRKEAVRFIEPQIS